MPKCWCRTLCLAGRRLEALDGPLQSLLLSSRVDTTVLGAAAQQVYAACTLALSCIHLSASCSLRQEQLAQVCRCLQLVLGSGRVALEQAAGMEAAAAAMDFAVFKEGLLAMGGVTAVTLLGEQACVLHATASAAGAPLPYSSLSDFVEQAVPPALLLPRLRTALTTSCLPPGHLLHVPGATAGALAVCCGNMLPSMNDWDLLPGRG